MATPNGCHFLVPLGVETLLTSKFDHYQIVLNTEVINERKTRRKIFRYKAKWALEEDGEQTIQSAWQYISFSSNYWTNIRSKLSFCSKELVRWYAKKKKISKQELMDKTTMLKTLQNQPTSNMIAIKNLEKEINLCWSKKIPSRSKE